MTDAWAARGSFPFIDGSLRVGGLPLDTLAERAGGTPFYVYDRARVTERVRALRAALPTGLRLHYAVKANPFPDLLRHLAPLVDGMDVASGGELAATLAAGVAAADISFAGPGKRLPEMRRALEADVLFNVESEGELGRLARLGEETGRAPRVALRINPDFEIKTSGVRMGGGAKPFGIDAETAPALLAETGRRGLRFEGFHFFPGAQNLNAASIVEAQNRCLDLARRLAADAPSPVTVLNIGGGFGIPYFPGETPLDLAPIGENLARAMERLKTEAPRARLTIELGRYLVGEAGLYVCRVVDRKVSRGQVFLVVDGGLHHHLAASGHFGQVIRKNYPVEIGNRPPDGAREVVSVVGPLCTPMDLLADRVELPRADVGDFVVVHQSGAYGLTASPLRFLGHPPPGEMLV